MSVHREKHYNEVLAMMRKRVEGTVARAGLTFLRELKLKLSLPGKGRLYARKNGTRQMSQLPHFELTKGQVISILLKERARLTKARSEGKAARKKSLRTLGVHRASAPLAPPAVDTGTLRRSIQADVSELSNRNPRVRVGTNNQYAKGLEYGTRRVIRRPYFKPTVAKVRPMIRKLFDAKGLLGGGIQ